MTDKVLTNLVEGVLTITLNRPNARNAMSLEMVGALRTALETHERNPALRVIVLRGEGGHFCAGGDIKDMAVARSAEVGDFDPIQKLNASFGRLALAYSRTPVPVIAVLEGAVMGGGFGLACTADVAIATTTADFRLPETSLGLIPAQIAPFLLQRLGFSEANRLALTGAHLNAAEAKQVGLVHHVCEPEDLERTLAEELAKFLACSPSGTAATKKLLQRLSSRLQDEDIEHAATVFAEAARGPEAAEGMSAFIEKRKPSWAPEQ